jgi:hypothetical protein
MKSKDAEVGSQRLKYCPGVYLEGQRKVTKY